MDLGQITRWRDLISKVGAAFCMIALLAVVDGLLVHFLEPSTLFKVLPGEVAGIDGNLTDEAKSVEDLTYESNSDQLKVTFEALHPGYFLGGDMWRGRLIVGPQISPGEYRLVVKHKRSSSGGAGTVFRIMVFPDALSLRNSSSSQIRRWFGVSAFGVAAGCLPGILLAFGMVYWLSGRRNALLAAAGKAEVYRVIRGDGELEIHFALGTAQGMSPGTVVAIYNVEGRQVGTATVEVSNPTDSAARATNQEIKVGYLVCRA